MSGHTPGPWRVGGKTPDRTDAYFPESVRDITAYLGGGVTMVIAREVEADDARLIAAAPELLAALQWIAAHEHDAHTIVDPGSRALVNAMIANARAAIARVQS